MDHNATPGSHPPTGLTGPPGSYDSTSPITMEDRAFLEEFGRRISTTAGIAAVVGGLGAYGAARYSGSRRRILWTTFGTITAPLVSWYYVMAQEKDRITPIAQRLQLAAAQGNLAPREASAPEALGDDALARLFPPPPSAAVAAAGLPRGLIDTSPTPSPLGGLPPSAFRPPGM
mmetsp:Transcript_106475/g.206174  ORF Transcript_106475/g.206174 Transcript_106475/m.206174 type:complete len:174 (-) Transcript_106475:40-561(-)